MRFDDVASNRRLLVVVPEIKTVGLCDFNIGEQPPNRTSAPSRRRCRAGSPRQVRQFDNAIDRLRTRASATNLARGMSLKLPCSTGAASTRIDLPGFGGDQNARTPADGSGTSSSRMHRTAQGRGCKSEIAHVGIVAPVSSAGCDVRRSARFGRDSRSRHGQVTAATSLYTSGTVGAGWPGKLENECRTTEREPATTRGVRKPRARNTREGDAATPPFLLLLYIVARLDRVNVGFAALQMNHGPRASADTVYGFSAGIFSISGTRCSRSEQSHPGPRGRASLDSTHHDHVGAGLDRDDVACLHDDHLLCLAVHAGRGRGGIPARDHLLMTYWFPREQRCECPSHGSWRRYHSPS